MCVCVCVCVCVHDCVRVHVCLCVCVYESERVYAPTSSSSIPHMITNLVRTVDVWNPPLIFVPPVVDGIDWTKYEDA